MSAGEFGDRLKVARGMAKLTQAQCAAQVEKTQTAWSYWESGRTEPSIQDLEVIGRVLNVSLDYLVWGGDVARRRVSAPARSIDDATALPTDALAQANALWDAYTELRLAVDPHGEYTLAAIARHAQIGEDAPAIIAGLRSQIDELKAEIVERWSA